VSQGRHRLEGQQQHQQLTAPGKSKRKTRRQNRPRSVKAGAAIKAEGGEEVTTA
jgi:hypothetical protein